MKARQLVAGVPADVGGKRSECARIVCLKFGEAIQITPCRRIVELGRAKRLEGPQRLGLAAQHQIAHRSAAKLRNFRYKVRADAHPRAELFVGGLKSRRDVNRIAIGRVIEKPAATEIAHNRRSGVRADAGDPERDPLLPPALAKRLRAFVQGQRTGDGARRMIRLLARRAEQHVHRITDDLGDRSVVGEYHGGHADEIVVKERPEHVRLNQFHELGETVDVGEHHSDVAPLATQIDGVGVVGKTLCEIRRKVARQRRMRPFRRRLPFARFAQHFDMPDRLGDRRFQVGKIDWLSQEVECAAIHRRTDVGHVAVGRDDDGRKLLLALLQLLQQRQPVHSRHVDVGHHNVDRAVGLEQLEGVNAVAGENERNRPVTNLMPELLLDQRLQVRFIIDDEDLRSHAELPTRESISLRRLPKSIGLVTSASAPCSSALRLVSASP